jgi:hypothetical protein
MNQLNYRETLIAYASVDATAASIAMAISDKNVLAARKILLIGIALQGTAFCIQGVVISRISRFDQTCLSQTPHPCFSSSTTIMWTFWAVRMLATFAPIPTAYRLSNRLDEVEHAPRDGLQVKEARTWYSLPSTLFSNYLIFLSITLFQGVPTLLIADGSLSTSWTMLWTEWGQSAALIVAVAAILHVVYFFGRLFRMEAVEHRMRICEANKTSVGWAQHSPSQLRMLSWENISLRSPFGKIDLIVTDRLFIEDSELDSKLKIQITMTDEERDALWKELLVAFQLNDKVGIKDCLARGASMDRMDQYGEYPIHMAARLGDVSILAPTHLPDGIDRLLSRNKSGDTPLQVAYSSNQLETMRWLLDINVKKLDDKPWEPMARKAIDRLVKSAIDAERQEVLEVIIDTLPEWWNFALEDEQGQLHGLIVTALMQDKPISAIALSKRLDRTFKPSRYDLEDFYGNLPGEDIDRAGYMDQKAGFRTTLYRRLVRYTPHILDIKSLGLDKCSTSFSLAYICWIADRSMSRELISDLVSSKLALPRNFIDAVYTFSRLAPTGAARSDLIQRGALDWSEVLTADVEKVKNWIEKTAKTEDRIRMLQVSSYKHNLPVNIALNWKVSKRQRPTATHLLELMKNDHAPIHHPHYDVLGDYLHPISLSKRWQKPVKRMVLDMALAQENRESTPGLTVWVICDIIIATRKLHWSGRGYDPADKNIWYLQCLELILLEAGPQAYKKRRFSHSEDPETPFQLLCKELKLAQAIRDQFYVEHMMWLLKEAIQLLKPWEEFHIGKHSAPPSSMEHPEWQSFSEWEDTQVPEDAGTESPVSEVLEEEKVKISSYSDEEWE